MQQQQPAAQKASQVPLRKQQASALHSSPTLTSSVPSATSNQPPSPEPIKQQQNETKQQTEPAKRAPLQRIAVKSLAPAPKWADEPEQVPASKAPEKDQKSVAKVKSSADKSADAKTPAAAAKFGAAAGKSAAAKSKTGAAPQPKPSAGAGASAAAGESDDSGGGADSRLKIIKSFDDLKLNDSLLRGVYAFGFETPSLIQQKAIAPIIAGYDTIAQAQSGSGKSATFLIAALQRLDMKVKGTQVLILSPTRELAQQTTLVAKAIGDFLAPTVHLCTGGTLSSADRLALSGGAQVVIGTPGRVLHLLTNKSMKTHALSLLIIDEADEMLSQGFQEQMYAIFQFLPPTIQIALFSATLPASAVQLANKFLRDPVRITIKQEDVTLEGIKQFYVDLGVGEDHGHHRRHAASAEDALKLSTLIDLYESVSVSQCIIYANTRRRVEWLSDELNSRDFTVSAIHAELEPSERAAVMSRFRQCVSRVLVSTDLLARGIDVQGVSLVINFDLPRDRENYIHRIGRSGRFGRKGVAINLLANHDDLVRLRDLEAYYHTKTEELPNNLKDLL